MATKIEKLQEFVQIAITELLEQTESFEDENTLKLLLNKLVEFELAHNGKEIEISGQVEFTVNYWILHPEEKLNTVIFRAYNSYKKHERKMLDLQQECTKP